MKRKLEEAWREISADLDDVLDLDAGARVTWLEALQARDPERAARVRSYLQDLETLEKERFLVDGSNLRSLALRSLESLKRKE
jgi:hypothetical protein